MTAGRPTVLKFGGTSVADAAACTRLVNIVKTASAGGGRPVVVVSALSRVTDALLAAAHAARGDADHALRSLDPHLARHQEIADALIGSSAVRTKIAQAVARTRQELGALLTRIADDREPRAPLQDEVASYGERLSAELLAAVLEAADVRACYVDARRCVVTEDSHGTAAPLVEATNARTRAELAPLLLPASDHPFTVPVIGGFIGATIDGRTTLLGRGGSDYTAALVGAALDARELQIWTDVSGVLTADPRIVARAYTIPRLSYVEAAELAYFGAKVLHPKTIQPAIRRAIPVRILNSRAPDDAGTTVGAASELSPRTVKAIAHKRGVTTIEVTSARMLGAYGFLRALFEVFERHRTVVDVVTTSEISVSLSLDDTDALPLIVPELRRFATVELLERRAVVCIVGEGLRSTPGIAAKVFGTIRDLNVSLISQGASSVNLTFVVAEDVVDEVVRRLHQTFFERDTKELYQAILSESLK